MPKKAVLTIVILVLISPIFGVIGAEIVGYREPLELAAEKIGLKELKPIWKGIFPDYTVPGLPDEIGYILAGLVGVLVLLAPAIIKKKG